MAENKSSDSDAFLEAKTDRVLGEVATEREQLIKDLNYMPSQENPWFNGVGRDVPLTASTHAKSLSEATDDEVKTLEQKIA